MCSPLGGDNCKKDHGVFDSYHNPRERDFSFHGLKQKGNTVISPRRGETPKNGLK
jgi:hypothetical protein